MHPIFYSYLFSSFLFFVLYIIFVEICIIFIVLIDLKKFQLKTRHVYINISIYFSSFMQVKEEKKKIEKEKIINYILLYGGEIFLL